MYLSQHCQLSFPFFVAIRSPASNATGIGRCRIDGPGADGKLFLEAVYAVNTLYALHPLDKAP